MSSNKIYRSEIFCLDYYIILCRAPTKNSAEFCCGREHTQTRVSEADKVGSTTEMESSPLVENVK